MLIIPAVDIKDGRCVRLRQGRLDDDTVYSQDPAAMADRWIAAGARRLHLVDLDGAVQGRPVNAAVVREIARRHPEIPIQIGGGIRAADTIAAYLDAGIEYAILGTQAVREPDFVPAMCRAFPGRIIVGLDVKDGLVAIAGWLEVSAITALDLARRFEDAGVAAIVYTNIQRDGMMKGVDVESTVALAEALTIPVIASGGITDLGDIHALAAARCPRILGAITGRAIYEGSLDLTAAQRLADELEQAA